MQRRSLLALVPLTAVAASTIVRSMRWPLPDFSRASRAMRIAMVA